MSVTTSAAPQGRQTHQVAPLVARGMTVADVRRRLAQTFREAGLDTPELDARVLVGHALGLDHAALAARAEDALAAKDADQIAALARRRLAREPVARILGRKEFWGLPIMLDAATLVPRPQTETVVEAALNAIDCGGARMRPLQLADLGTGSGALIIALLSELPAARAIATDTSTAALACARANAAALGFDRRVDFIACDYAAALKGPFDLLTANPPYIARGEIATLDPEVRNFDPKAALDGGRDGLDGYRTIAAQAPRLLAPAGHLVLELGAGQREEVAAIMVAAGLRVAASRCDLAGVARALVVDRS